MKERYNFKLRHYASYGFLFPLILHMEILIIYLNQTFVFERMCKFYY